MSSQTVPLCYTSHCYTSYVLQKRYGIFLSQLALCHGHPCTSYRILYCWETYLLVITEWISSQTTLTTSHESLSVSIHSSSTKEDHFCSTSFIATTKIIHYKSTKTAPMTLTYCCLALQGWSEALRLEASSCWKKKNDVAKMRQADTAPATGTTIYCLTSLWCTVIYKRCSVMDTTNTLLRANVRLVLRSDLCLVGSTVLSI